MKVLFLLSRIEKSGVALHTLDLSQGLAARGHKIVMITGGVTDPDSEYLMSLYNDFLDTGARVYKFKTPKGNILFRAVISVISIIRILGLIIKVKADVIHAQSPYMTFLPWLLGKKYVSTVHNVQLEKNIKYKNPTKLIAISKESKEFAISTLGAREENVEVVCHGVSKRFAKPISDTLRNKIRVRHGIGMHDVIIGFVGRITVDKGLDILFKAVENYMKIENSSRVKILILGSYFSPSDEEWHKERIAKSPLREQVVVIPFSDPQPYYHIFDIFVLPSYSEAFGLVCVEAMMAGCATVRTDTNGALDQIEHGEDGFIFPNRNAEVLSEILESLVEDPEYRRRIADKGQEKAMNKFTVKAMTSNTLDVYQSVQ